jgi:hypothetical protein
VGHSIAVDLPLEEQEVIVVVFPLAQASLEFGRIRKVEDAVDVWIPRGSLRVGR